LRGFMNSTLKNRARREQEREQDAFYLKYTGT